MDNLRVKLVNEKYPENVLDFFLNHCRGNIKNIYFNYRLNNISLFVYLFFNILKKGI